MDLYGSISDILQVQHCGQREKETNSDSTYRVIILPTQNNALFVSGKSLKIAIDSTTFKRGNLMTPEPITPKTLHDDTVDGSEILNNHLEWLKTL